MTFTLYDDTAVVRRQQYTTDTAWYRKSSYIDTGNIYTWHLKAQSIDKVENMQSFGKNYLFTTDAGADIQDSDRLVISWVNYEVMWVSDYQGKTFSTTKVLLKTI